MRIRKVNVLLEMIEIVRIPVKKFLKDSFSKYNKLSFTFCSSMEIH